MKRLIKLSLLFVVLFTVVTINASETNSVLKKSEMITVSFKDVKKGAILTIKDKNGLVVYKETITKDGDYAKGFDLTTLPDGLYYFELNKSVEISTIPFSVYSNEVIFNKDKEEVIFKPVVFVNDKKVHVSRTSLTDDSELKVKIYYESNDLVFTDMIKKQGVAFGKIYDFSTSEKGAYTLVMLTNGKRFVEQIKI